MRPIALIAGLLISAPMAVLASESWTELTTDAIQQALADKTLVYEDDIWQEFYASGQTLYHSGHDSWGTWDARGDQYCSQWPPADGWACYQVRSRGVQIKFIGESGQETVGTYAE